MRREALSLRTALRLGRVSNVPTVWTNVLAGMALTGAHIEMNVLLPLCLAMTAQYIGGMYLNDAFDAAWDRQHRKDRPIVAEHVPPRLVFVIGFSLLAAGITVVTLLSLLGIAKPLAIAAATVTAGLIVYYDVHHKNNPLSPLVMGLCRVGVYFVAATAVAPLTALVAFGSAVLLGHLIGLTYVAKHETRGRVARLWPLLMFLPAAVFSVLRPWPWWFLGAVYVAYTAGFGVAPALGWNKQRKPTPGQAVPSLIAAISLLDAVIVSRAGDMKLVVFCALAFALTRYWQRHVPGT